jgi:hypothetical protein
MTSVTGPEIVDILIILLPAMTTSTATELIIAAEEIALFTQAIPVYPTPTTLIVTIRLTNAYAGRMENAMMVYSATGPTLAVVVPVFMQGHHVYHLPCAMKTEINVSYNGQESTEKFVAILPNPSSKL